jgi:hypothetical protein
MAQTKDPISTAAAGTFERFTSLKVYRGSTPSAGGYLNEDTAEADGSAAVTCKGVGAGTDVCVVGKGGGHVVTVYGQAGGPLSAVDDSDGRVVVYANPGSKVKVYAAMGDDGYGGFNVVGEPLEEVEASSKQGKATLHHSDGWIVYELGDWPKTLQCPHCGEFTVKNGPRPVQAVQIVGAQGELRLDPLPGVGAEGGVRRSMPQSAGREERAA